MTVPADRWIVEDHRTGPNPVATPVRRKRSIRRTTSLEVCFPGGRGQPAKIRGVGRDLVTTATGAAKELVCDALDLKLDMNRIVRELMVSCGIEGLQQLVGESSIVGFRKRLWPILQDSRATERPLAQLLDDIVGSSIILEWIWTRWEEDIEEIRRTIGDQSKMEGSCHAYAPGSSAFESEGHLKLLYLVPPLQRRDDPLAFHELAADAERTQRRVRRMDVWDHKGDTIRVDAMFQDSGVVSQGRRIAIHEYRVKADIDRNSMTLKDVKAEGGMLPHQACRSAPASLTELLGLPVDKLRVDVLQRLKGTKGCTHLNDVVRALSSVSFLYGRLCQER